MREIRAILFSSPTTSCSLLSVSAKHRGCHPIASPPPNYCSEKVDGLCLNHMKRYEFALFGVRISRQI
ncbi:hypothetical protein ACS0TY_029199 [Phlomoides rotata]